MTVGHLPSRPHIRRGGQANSSFHRLFPDFTPAKNGKETPSAVEFFLPPDFTLDAWVFGVSRF